MPSWLVEAIGWRLKYNNMVKIRMILWLPLSWLLWIMYATCKDRKKLLMDLARFRKVHYGAENETLVFWKLYQEFIGFAEFRSVFWFRCGKFSKLVSWIFPAPETQLSFDCRTENVGGDLYPARLLYRHKCRLNG